MCICAPNNNNPNLQADDSSIGGPILPPGRAGLHLEHAGQREPGARARAAGRLPAAVRVGARVYMQKMMEKLADPSELFKRLTLGYNEIEKEMMSRYATVEEIDYN